MERLKKAHVIRIMHHAWSKRHDEFVDCFIFYFFFCVILIWIILGSCRCATICAVVQQKHISLINHSSACVSICAFICDIRIVRIVQNDNIPHASFIAECLSLFFSILSLLFFSPNGARFFFLSFLWFGAFSLWPSCVHLSLGRKNKIKSNWYRTNWFQ